MDHSLKQVVAKLKEKEHGFKHIIEAGDIDEEKQISLLDLALVFLKEEAYQARLFETYLLGLLSIENPKAC